MGFKISSYAHDATRYPKTPPICFAILYFVTKNRLLGFTIYLLFLLSGPITVLANTPFSEVLENEIVLINFFQRSFGTIAYVMLFVQIFLGSKMWELLKFFGAKAFKYHVTHGLIAYAFILIHPFMQMAIDVNLRGPLAGLLTFLPGRDIFLNLGKLAFVLVTAGAAAGYLRTRPFLRRNWRKLHILNYLAFIFVSIHAWNLGTDAKSFPFVITFFTGVLAVNLIIVHNLFLFAKSKLRERFQAQKSLQESE